MFLVLNFSKVFWTVLLIVLFSLCFLVTQFYINLKSVVVPSRHDEIFFRYFARDHEKFYPPAEFQKRWDIFNKGLNDIQRLNKVHDGFPQFGLTKFSDMTEDEFASIHLKSKNRPIAKTCFAKTKNVITVHESGCAVDDDKSLASIVDPKIWLNKSFYSIPERVDWREKGVLQAVRNQGHCGSCWANSVTEMMESQLAIYKNFHEPLSIQQMIDCARNGNEGCNNGDQCRLLEWLIKNEINIRTEMDYAPSLTGKNETCRIPINDKPGALKVFRSLASTCNSFIGKEDDLLKIIANYGPVVVGVNACAWQHYVGGIVKNECPHGRLDINHAVLIVGFDRSSPEPYYIVQNSWGVDFGENGFVKVAIGKNHCCIVTEVSLVKMDGRLN